MEAAKSPFKIHDRIVTGLMLVCAFGFVCGALFALGF
jgi:hypothetical protein